MRDSTYNPGDDKIKIILNLEEETNDEHMPETTSQIKEEASEENEILKRTEKEETYDDHVPEIASQIKKEESDETDSTKRAKEEVVYSQSTGQWLLTQEFVPPSAWASQTEKEGEKSTTEPSQWLLTQPLLPPVALEAQNEIEGGEKNDSQERARKMQKTLQTIDIVRQKKLNKQNFEGKVRELQEFQKTEWEAYGKSTSELAAGATMEDDDTMRLYFDKKLVALHTKIQEQNRQAVKAIFGETHEPHDVEAWQWYPGSDNNVI
jgi:hypothetical protein